MSHFKLANQNYVQLWGHPSKPGNVMANELAIVYYARLPAHLVGELDIGIVVGTTHCVVSLKHVFQTMFG